MEFEQVEVFIFWFGPMAHYLHLEVLVVSEEKGKGLQRKSAIDSCFLNISSEYPKACLFIEPRELHP